MGIAVSIVSEVLKSVVGNRLGSGLTKEIADISIDGISEKGINYILNFIDEEKHKIDCVLSKENMKNINITEDHIDYVRAEIKNLLSEITITDEIFRQCRYDKTKLKDFMWGAYVKNRNKYIENENEIKIGIFAVAEALTKLMEESEEFNIKMLKQISNSVDDVNMELLKISECMEGNFGKFSTDIHSVLEILQMILEQNQKESLKNDKKQKVKCRTQEYADKWNANMFLNNFDEWDESTGVNTKLSDVYIDEHLPHFVWGENKKVFDNLDVLLFRYIIERNENKMLLILGLPGIGKSTLITWITNKFKQYLGNILVYKFAEDLKDIDWQKTNISTEILDTLNLSYNDLEEKILILDGFDEVSIGTDSDRREVLDNLYGELIYKSNIKNFLVIITCRENYIQKLERIKCKYIILQLWNEIQITSFCNIFQEKTKNCVSDGIKEKLLEKKEIFGIPLILYMVLALDISIEKDGSTVDVYDKIFSLEGGIYDRCIDNKKFADKHRIGEVKEYIHQISREIAIWMFENKPEEVCIPQEEYEKICNHIMKDFIYEKEDFKIGNFFKSIKHCEGTEKEELYFVHRSIYEYFVVDAIYSSIENAMIELSMKSQEEFAGGIAVYLKRGVITKTIGEYLYYKIVKLYNKIDFEKRKRFYQWWELAIGKMMNKGMFFYCTDNMINNQNYIDFLDRESKCFMNLMDILRLIVNIDGRTFIMKDVGRKNLEKYIKYCCLTLEVNNSGSMILNLSDMWLYKVKLSGVNLSGANLSRAYLWNADLERANLSDADLEDADLKKANLKGAKLIKANLRGTCFNGANLFGASLGKSFWRKADIQRISSQLKNTNFIYIFQDKKKIFREELFPGEK